MRTSMRIASIASCVAVAGLLGACTTTRTVAYTVPVPVATAPTVVESPTVVTTPVAAVEYGRITNIQYFPGGTAATRLNVPGAIVGGVAGAVIGNQVGRAVGSRDATTVLGGAAGAVVGSQAGSTTIVDTAYRITIQTDQGVLRILDVPSTGDLRIGDRVRIDNGVIYHS